MGKRLDWNDRTAGWRASPLNLNTESTCRNVWPSLSTEILLGTFTILSRGLFCSKTLHTFPSKVRATVFFVSVKQTWLLIWTLVLVSFLLVFARPRPRAAVSNGSRLCQTAVTAMQDERRQRSLCVPSSQPPHGPQQTKSGREGMCRYRTRL